MQQPAKHFEHEPFSDLGATPPLTTSKRSSVYVGSFKPYKDTHKNTICADYLEN